MKSGPYMRNDYLAPDEHQIIYSNSCPFPSAACFLASPHPKLRTSFAATVKKDPDMIPFLDLTTSARDIGAIIEDKRNDDLSGFDGFLHEEEFLAQLLSRLGFPEQRGLRHGLRCHRKFGVRTKSFPSSAIIDFCLRAR